MKEIENELSKIKQKLNRICSNEACQKIYETLKFKCDDFKSLVAIARPMLLLIV